MLLTETNASNRRIEHPLYSIALDEGTGIIRVDRLAVLRVEEVETYIGALGEVVRNARLRYGTVRLLADLRQSPVRTREAAEALRDRNAQMYRPGERVALVVDSMLLRLQLQRNQIKAHQEIFTDVPAAERWLLAD